MTPGPTCETAAQSLRLGRATVGRAHARRAKVAGVSWWQTLHPAVWESVQAAERIARSRPELAKAARPLWTVKQFARLFGIHRSSVRRRLDWLLLPTVRVSRVELVPLSALVEADPDLLDRLARLAASEVS